LLLNMEVSLIATNRKTKNPPPTVFPAVGFRSAG
jgi:hypothetical protein